jgi:hypothetical protein
MFSTRRMSQNWFFHILRFLHLADDTNSPDGEENCDCLWMLRKLSSYLNSRYAKVYHPTEHLALDEVIVLFKGKVVFRQYIPKKHEEIWHKNLQAL